MVGENKQFVIQRADQRDDHNDRIGQNFFHHDIQMLSQKIGIFKKESAYFADPVTQYDTIALISGQGKLCRIAVME